MSSWKCRNIAFALVFFISAHAYALTRGFSVNTFKPATDGGRFFTLYDATPLKSLEAAAGMAVSYAFRPFQLTQGDNRVRGVIDHDIVVTPYISMGLIDKWLEAGVSAPAAVFHKYVDPAVAAASPAETKMVFGDIELNLKTALLRLDDRRVGISFLPFVSFPTGSGRYFFGSGTFMGGGKFIVEARPSDKISLALNTGASARKKYVIGDIDQDYQLLYGVGGSLKASDKVWVTAELNGKARLLGLFKEKRETPLEGLIGMRWRPAASGLALFGGGGGGIFTGSEVPLFRAFAGVSYQGSLKRAGGAAGRPDYLMLKLAVTPKTIHFGFNNTTIADEEASLLDEVASIMKAEDRIGRLRLTGHADDVGTAEANQKISEQRAEEVKRYLIARGVEAGRITTEGQGMKQPLKTGGRQIDRDENRRVELAFEERGEEEKKPEYLMLKLAVTPKTIHFGLNGVKVSVEEASLLDEVASIMKAEKGIGRLRIIGHADDIGTEEANQKISEARAEEVKRYLVARGVEESRIVTEGRGRKQPVVTGGKQIERDENRRVELVFE